MPTEPPSPPRESLRCPTLCDPDCEAKCHELHQVPYKRDHTPESHGVVWARRSSLWLTYAEMVSRVQDAVVGDDE